MIFDCRDPVLQCRVFTPEINSPAACVLPLSAAVSQTAGPGRPCGAMSSGKAGAVVEARV
jgi:hypothetical protein